MNIVNCPLLLAHSRHFCLMKNLFPIPNSSEIVFSTFSCLNLRYLITKLQKRNIRICQKVHNEHRKLSTFTRTLTSFLFDEKFVSLSKFLQNFVSSPFSRFILTCLMIKS